MSRRAEATTRACDRRHVWPCPASTSLLPPPQHVDGRNKSGVKAMPYPVEYQSYSANNLRFGALRNGLPSRICVRPRKIPLLFTCNSGEKAMKPRPSHMENPDKHAIATEVLSSAI